MKTPVKSAVDSALLAAVIGLACLWLLLSATNAEDVSPARAVLFAIGLGVSWVAHLSYMGLALHRAGRAVLPWMVGMVLLFPLVSVVALVLLGNAEQADKAEKAGTRSQA